MANTSITVLGVVKEAGGLKESLGKFRRHSNDTGAAILNVMEGRSEDDDRPAYVRQDWPKMLYRADGSEVIAKNQESADYYTNEEGYRYKPYPKVQVLVADAAAEKKAVKDDLAQKDGELRSMQEQNDKLMARLRALESVVVRSGLMNRDDDEEEGEPAAAPASGKKTAAVKKAS